MGGNSHRLRPAPQVVGGPGITTPSAPNLTLDPQFDLDPTLLGNEAFLHLSGLGTGPRPDAGEVDDLARGNHPPVSAPPNPMWVDRAPTPIPSKSVPRPTVTQPQERPPQQDSAGFKGKTVDPRPIGREIKKRL